jgi:hypothetical protein
MEIVLIAAHNATDPRYGYNADRGGSTGAKHTEQTRKKIGAANSRRIWSAESRKKLQARRTGSHADEATKQKMSQAQRGRKHSPETRERIRAAQAKRPVKNATTGRYYGSVQQAAADTGCSSSSIVKVCRGKRHSHGGYVWEYVEVVP